MPGEFAGGDAKSLHDNVVQNNLCALALLITADMEDESGDHATAKLWRKDARSIFENMEKYLVSKDGSWIWCIEPKTLKPDPAFPELQQTFPIRQPLLWVTRPRP